MEQEKLCTSFGGDWESLLAAERRRNIHRAAVVDMDVTSLQEHFAKHASQQEEDSEVDSTRDGESTASSTSDDLSLMHIIDLEQALGDRARDRCSIAIRCRRSSQVGADRRSAVSGAQQEDAANAHHLTGQLKQLMSDVDLAQGLAHALSEAGTPEVDLHPVIAIDPAGGQNELLIRARHVGIGKDGVSHPTEWITDRDFQARLLWLQEHQVQDAQSPQPRALDAWAAAGQRSNAADEAESSEVQRLRAELASVRAERDALRLDLAKMHSSTAFAGIISSDAVCKQQVPGSSHTVAMRGDAVRHHQDGSRIGTGFQEKFIGSRTASWLSKAQLCDGDPLRKVQGMASAIAMDLEETVREMDEVALRLQSRRADKRNPMMAASLNSTEELCSDSLFL
jgi:hypothetical protein